MSDQRSDKDKLQEARTLLNRVYFEQGGEPSRWAAEDHAEAIVMLAGGIAFGWKDY